MESIKATINGLPCVYMEGIRAEQRDAPDGYPYMYHLRHDEDYFFVPVNIERPNVVVNFLGTIFTKKVFDFDDSGYLDVESFSLDGADRLVIV